MFTLLKDEKQWDEWEHATKAQALAQDVADMLDPAYVPIGADQIALFQEKQKYMYAVFEKALRTDHGKASVCKYQTTFDAQKVYSAVKTFAEQSTKASIESSTLLAYITSVCIGDGSWKGTSHSFILHWQDSV